MTTIRLATDTFVANNLVFLLISASLIFRFPSLMQRNKPATHKLLRVSYRISLTIQLKPMLVITAYLPPDPTRQ